MAVIPSLACPPEPCAKEGRGFSARSHRLAIGIVPRYFDSGAARLRSI